MNSLNKSNNTEEDMVEAGWNKKKEEEAGMGDYPNYPNMRDKDKEAGEASLCACGAMTAEVCAKLGGSPANAGDCANYQKMTSSVNDEEYEDWGEIGVSAAEYQGKKVTLNKPFRTSGGPKKFGVYTRNEKGNVVIVRFGDPNMEIKRDDPARRKSFRSRHNCSSPGPKWKARYWSCRMWSSKPVNKMTSQEITEKAGCGCGCAGESVEAAMPTPKDDETHEAFMMRCEAMGNSKADCMSAHEGHTFEAKDKDDPCTDGYEQFGMKMKNGRKVPNCVPIAKVKELKEAGHSKDTYMVDDEKKEKASVNATWNCKITDIVANVEAATGKTIMKIKGIAFHEGYNKNNWSITRDGAEAVARQMIGGDLTLNHPSAKESGAGFSRNMDGGVDEAVVGIITQAGVADMGDGKYEVHYEAQVWRAELFESLESGVWLRGDYGVSIGGYGVPIEATEEGAILFGEDFTFDHLAIVYRPAYERASIDEVSKVELSASIDDEFKYPAEIALSHTEQVKNMTASEESPDTGASNDELEALRAELILANATIAKHDEEKAAIAEASRVALVKEASELGLKGHEDLSEEVVASLIASWKSANPVTEEVLVEATPATTVEVEASVATESTAVVANYLNGTLVETPEPVYERAFNAWARAWNRSLSGEERKKGHHCPTFAEAREAGDL